MTIKHRWPGNCGATVVLSIVCLGFTAGCAVVEPRVESSTPSAGVDQTLLRVPQIIRQRWRELVLRGRTDYTVAIQDQRLAIRAVGRHSASGLLRELEVDVKECAELVWSWRVDRLQPGADIRVKAKEDVAASIVLLFGDPGMLVSPDPVPTLRYVWTNDKVAEETIVDSPYLPGVVRSLVVRSGDQHLGEWLVEQRNVHDDFVEAFGHVPEDGLYAVALFTDNDQTGQAVEAYYEWIEIHCQGN